MKKKKIISLILILTVIGGGSYIVYNKYYNSSNANIQVVGEDIYTKSSKGDLKSSIRVLGETSLLEEQRLNFNNEGNISGVFVKEGQMVTEGQLLAELDKGQLQNELKEANIKLENSKLNLQKISEKFYNEDKLRSQIDLENKKKELDLAKFEFKNIDSDQKMRLESEKDKLNTMKVEVENQEKNLENEKSKITNNLTDAYKELEFKIKTLGDEKGKLESTIKDTQVELENAVIDYYQNLRNTYIGIETQLNGIEDNLDLLNNALRTDNEKKKQEPNIYFSAKNTTYKNQAEIYYGKTKGGVINLRKELDKYSQDTINIDELANLTKGLKEIYENLSKSGEFTSKGAEYSLETESFTIGEIESIKSSSNSIKNSAIQSKNSIDSEVIKIKNIKDPEFIREKSRIEIEKLEKELKDLEPNLEKMKIEFDSLKITTPEKIKSLEVGLKNSQREYQKSLRDFEEFIFKLENEYKQKELNIKQLEIDLETLEKEYKRKYNSKNEPEEIVYAQNEVKQAEIGVDQVQKRIENYEIRAPFNGQIESFSMKAGDKLGTSSNSTEKYIHIINPGLMEIKLKLDQIDIVKVQKGMLTQVTFDSYPDKIFEGELGSIDTKPIDEGGVKKYQVKLIIDKGDLNIFGGMSANVEIVIENIKDAILVPSMSIENNPETGINYVTIKKDGKKIKQEIETGIISNGMTQVISGLEEGIDVLEVNFDANNFQIEDFNNPGFGGGMMY
ncbi:MAG: biotin/lipoyl-binding protein [Candidatus Gracilibacteria bacterium]|nr:biotin/lipoyl-binding protein [Candidatus Gracilibacteria bacterium]